MAKINFGFHIQILPFGSGSIIIACKNAVLRLVVRGIKIWIVNKPMASDQFSDDDTHHMMNTWQDQSFGAVNIQPPRSVSLRFFYFIFSFLQLVCVQSQIAYNYSDWQFSILINLIFYPEKILNSMNTEILCYK